MANAKNNLEDEFAAIARKAAEQIEPEENRGALEGGEFQDVIQQFVGGLRKLEYLDADARLANHNRSLIHIYVWPKLRPAERSVFLTLWEQKTKGKHVVSVLGASEVVLKNHKKLTEYLKDLLNEEVTRDSLREMRSRYEGPADGMLRCRSLGYLTSSDRAVVIPRADFERLALARGGEPLAIHVEEWKGGPYDAGTIYKYLTSSGHVLDIAAGGVAVEDHTLLVRGTKHVAERRAA
jgi:hypothetical protein